MPDTEKPAGCRCGANWDLFGPSHNFDCPCNTTVTSVTPTLGGPDA